MTDLKLSYLLKLNYEENIYFWLNDLYVVFFK